MKYCFWFLLLIAGIPLLIYPAVLLANVMSLAGHPSAKPIPPELWLTCQGFLWSSTFYPLVYVYCARQAVARSKVDNFRGALNMSMLPLLYLCLVAAFFCGWMITSRSMVSITQSPATIGP
jgi:hypothetical protein